MGVSVREGEKEPRGRWRGRESVPLTARIHAGQDVDKVPNILLLLPCGIVRVLGGKRVQKHPRAAPELLAGYSAAGGLCWITSRERERGRKGERGGGGRESLRVSCDFRWGLGSGRGWGGCRVCFWPGKGWFFFQVCRTTYRRDVSHERGPVPRAAKRDAAEGPTTVTTTTPVRGCRRWVVGRPWTVMVLLLS